VFYHGGGFPELERRSMIYNRTGLFPQDVQELPALKALGDARHALEGQRASWAMDESAAAAHLRDWRLV